MRVGAVVLLAAALTGGSIARTADAWTGVSDPARRAQAPEVAVGPDGSIHVVWLDKGPLGTADRRGEAAGHGHSHQSFTDLMYARSDDGGGSFSAPLRVNARDGEVWGFSVSKPRIGIGPPGIVHVFYPANRVSSRTGKAVASSVHVRSTDGGRTFSPPRQLNGDGEQDLSALVHGGLSQAHVFGTLALGADGAVHAFWLDTRGMRPERPLSAIYAATSRNDGASFEPERALYDVDACPCCQLTATAAGEALYLGSRQVSADNIRTPTVAVSRDGGRSFGARVGIGGTPWQLDGCPLKPTALAAEGEYVYTLVHNGAEQPPGLLFARSTDGGHRFGPATRIHPGATVSDAPMLVAAWRGLYAFWHAKAGGGERRVFMRTSTDHGASWSAVTELAAPTGAAAYPAAAAMPDGSVAVVWQQGERILADVVWTPVECAACRK